MRSQISQELSGAANEHGLDLTKEFTQAYGEFAELIQDTDDDDEEFNIMAREGMARIIGVIRKGVDSPEDTEWFRNASQRILDTAENQKC